MQSSNGEKTVQMLGVHRKRIEVMGDPKYDALTTCRPMRRKMRLRKTFKLGKDTPVWIAGSTHPGEEEIILDAHQQLMSRVSLVWLLFLHRAESKAAEEVD